MTSIKDIKRIGVAGAGTMGQSIAQITAMAGYKTVLYDLEEATLSKAVERIKSSLDEAIEKEKISQKQKEVALENIVTSVVLTDLKADLIIEAVVESIDVKQQFFRDLERLVDQNTIIATNTSSIPITRLGAFLHHPERFVGLHFFNPAHIMKLVEVISGAATGPDVAVTAKEFAETLNKVAVLANDSPGFIVNRVARHFYGEGLKLVEENVADVKTIDSLMCASGFKMGPFQLMDLIGVDTNFSVTTAMFNSFYQDSKFRPSRIQQQKVDAGHYGRKSGKGFYDYEI